MIYGISNFWGVGSRIFCLRFILIWIKDETIYLNRVFEIVNVEKNTKLATKTKKDDDEDPLKGLTFNVHINSEDREAKNNLVLPYEIIK